MILNINNNNIRDPHNMQWIGTPTIALAKKYGLDPQLIKYCEKTQNSFKDKPINKHNGLMKQVSKKLGYAVDKTASKANNEVKHYLDDEHHKLEDLPAYIKDTRKKYNLY